MDWPLLLRPLPRPVPPVRDETISSYLTRLAEANRLQPAGLRSLLAGNDRKDASVLLPALAAVTGMPLRNLAHAMPQICTVTELAGLQMHNRPRARPDWAFVACRRCAAGRPVTRWALHDDVVCSRHRRWISGGTEQPELSRQPEILHAHRRHRWLIRRHGRNTVMRAHRDARSICVGWRLDGIPDDAFDHRMAIFHGPYWRDSDKETTQTFDAAIYPQIVALTRLLASPFWRQHILKGWRSPNTFVAELRRTVAPDYVWGDYPRIRWRRDRDDPMLEWLIHIRRDEYEPRPPDHPWNLPETLHRATTSIRPQLDLVQKLGTPQLREPSHKSEPPP